MVWLDVIFKGQQIWIKAALKQNDGMMLLHLTFSAINQDFSTLQHSGLNGNTLIFTQIYLHTFTFIQKI